MTCGMSKKHLGDGSVLHRHVLHCLIIDLCMFGNVAMVHGEHIGLRGGGEVVVLRMFANALMTLTSELYLRVFSSRGTRIGYPDFV